MGNKATSGSKLMRDAVMSRPSPIKPSMFSLRASAHHGVPSNARALAFCDSQGILAVGTASGAVKLYGIEGLEVLLEGPATDSRLVVGVIHLKFTARQHLVAVYTDSSLRVFDLVSGAAICCISESWTTSVITSIETIQYNDYPFIFVATDDGEVHVIHEETGRIGTYVIQPQYHALPHTEGVTAMASHPKDSNLLLIAYDTCQAVVLWDLAKRKVVREFTLSGKVKQKPPPEPVARTKSSSVDEKVIINSPQSLSWHCSGKRFVAGYKLGGFAVFCIDKPHGLYRVVAETTLQVMPVKKIKWLCAPPTSKRVALPGAIVFSGGRPDFTEAKLLTLIYPPSDGRSADDMLVDLYKAEKLTWGIATIESVNHAEIATFETAQDRVDQSAKVAPLSLILLSGNPLDGCLPTISVQGLPCFVKTCTDDKEEWVWRIEQRPEPAIIPPLLQISPLKTFALVNLSHSDRTLQDDLFLTWNQAKYNSMFHLMERGDYEWPIDGGSIVEPVLKDFFTPDTEAGVAPNSMILLTGHANGHVLFWEAQTAGDSVSKGTIRLIHTIDVPLQMHPAPVNPEITCLAFCADSRTLVVGFVSGEVVVLEFHQVISEHNNGSLIDKDNNKLRNSVLDPEQRLKPDEVDSSLNSMDQTAAAGFRTLFSILVDTEPILKLVVSSHYGYVGIADAAGTVALVEIASHTFQRLIGASDPSNDDFMSINSLLMSEIVQTTEIPLSDSLPASSSALNTNSGKRSPSKVTTNGGDGNVQNVTQHREVIPVLYVGRGNGKLEIYHLQSATKMGETLVDRKETSSLSSLIMVDSDGKRIDIPGRKWKKQNRDLSVAGSGVDLGDSEISTDMVDPRRTEDTQVDDGPSAREEQLTQQAVGTDASYELTQQYILEAKHERAISKVVPPQIPKRAWIQSSPIQVTVPPGPLGLHLSMEVEKHAVVQGFADDSDTALLLKSKGVCVGHTLTSINKVDVTSLDRDSICKLLERLRERENVLGFAVGLKSSEMTVHDDIEASNNRIVDSRNVAEYERPRLLVCTCGRAIHVLQATVPRAMEMAMGGNEAPAQPVASIELQGMVLLVSVVRIPVGETVEYCLAVIDVSNRVSILSLPSLTTIWETDCTNLGLGLGCSGLANGNLSDISHGGELVVANAFGEIKRFSLLAEATALESAMLERMAIKTCLYLPERATCFGQAASPPVTDSGKKKGIAADAGKMFKKLVLSVTQETIDLNKVFHFSIEEDEHHRLMGDRSAGVHDADSSVERVESGISGTKDSLMQAQQRLAERGEKLNDLGLKTEQMKKTSEDFYRTMKAFNDKNADKKWYEF